VLTDDLRAIALERSRNSNDDSFVLRGLWRLALLFRPNPQERLFEYTVVVAQTLGQGSCYTEEDPPLDESVVGQDARNIRSSYSSIDIATLDAVYSVFPKRPSRSLIIEGSALDKSIQRAKIIVDEVTVQLGSSSNLEGKRVVNIGAVGNIVAELKNRGATVYVTDRDPRLVGSVICDQEVESHETNHERIEHCDLALVTGMTLSTGTLDGIMNQCRRERKKLIVFAETGANFGEEYCRLGADAVISEPFPFYIFSCVSRVDVYRAKA
jgi:uncharacterized protein (DUF4213/DUF364 family)